MHVLIVGAPGSGKTTEARRLARELNLPVYHLDHLFFGPGWRRVPDEERVQILRWITQQQDWIIEGSYRWVLPAVRATAPLVLEMQTPKMVCLFRLLKRHWRTPERPDLPAGCHDRLSAGMLHKIFAWRVSIPSPV